MRCIRRRRARAGQDNADSLSSGACNNLEICEQYLTAERLWDGTKLLDNPMVVTRRPDRLDLQPCLCRTAGPLREEASDPRLPSFRNLAPWLS